MHAVNLFTCWSITETSLCFVPPPPHPPVMFKRVQMQSWWWGFNVQTTVIRFITQCSSQALRDDPNWEYDALDFFIFLLQHTKKTLITIGLTSRLTNPLISTTWTLKVNSSRSPNLKASCENVCLKTPIFSKATIVSSSLTSAITKQERFSYWPCIKLTHNQKK